jgi:hypothetical protein
MNFQRHLFDIKPSLCRKLDDEGRNFQRKNRPVFFPNDCPARQSPIRRIPNHSMYESNRRFV